jgi:serine/threonine protein kinase
MNPEISFAETEALFHRAMDAPEAERALLIEQSTNGNPALRKEVFSLVEAVSAADRLRTDPDADREAKAFPNTESAIGTRLGAFQLDRLLGRGGMGEVYAGHRVDGDPQQTVAIKVIAGRLDSPELRAIFFRERDALARLQHPNIARLLDGGVAPDNSPYLVMELVGDEASPAERLDDYCERRRLTPRERVALVAGICYAVGYAHRKLIVHGDLKPGNVLVAANGNPMLLDFGAARLMAGEEAGARPRAFTPAYASPEQMQAKPIAAASDIYSMGKLLERVLGASKDIELATVVAKSTQAEPENRYATMEELEEDLRAWLEDRPLSVCAGRRSYAVRKWLRRNRKAVFATVVVLAALAGCIFETQRSARRAIEERDRAIGSAKAVETLAHRLLFDFQPQLKEIGSSTEAQHQVATTTLAYLNELSLDPSLSSESLRLDMANAYERMGNLLGNPYDENLGQPKEAVTALQKAVATASALVREKPSSREARFSLAMAQRSLAEVEFGTGNPKSALEAMTESAKNFQFLVQAPDATPQQLMEAAATFGSLGDVYGLPDSASLDRANEAVECYRQQIGLGSRTLKIDASNVRARRTLAVGEYKIANLIADKDTDGAIAGYGRALDDLSLFPKEIQSSGPTVRLQILIEAHLGNAYLKQGKTAEAIAKKIHARNQEAMLVARDPLDNRARYDLATIDRGLGRTLASAGDREGARRAYRQSLQTIEFMLNRDPDSKDLKELQRDVRGLLQELDRTPAARKRSRQ